MKAEWVEQDGARMWRGGGFSSHEYEAVIRVSFSSADIAALQSRNVRDAIPAFRNQIKDVLLDLVSKG
jgi:hypothetical protein